MAKLAAQELCKSFKGRKVVDNASLYVDSGEIVGLLGPNGAGKTTCFYIIVGLETPDSGYVFLDQREISQYPMNVRARLGVGYLPQDMSIYRRMSVYDNILSTLEARDDLTQPQRHAETLRLLEEFNIAHLRNHLGISLSGGERRRVEIARALALEPKFLLLDEPFAGVDPLSVADIQGVIRSLVKRNIGVLITEHNVRETLSICHRSYVLNNGIVIAEGSPETIMQNEQVKQVYLGEHFKF